MKRRAAEEARGRKENQAGGVTKRREVDAGGVYPASSHDRLVPHTWALSHSPHSPFINLTLDLKHGLQVRKKIHFSYSVN